MQITVKILKTAVALVGLVFLNACAEKSADRGFTNQLATPVEQIVGGTEVTSSKLVDSLFVLLVSDNNGTPQVCTGMFITKKHILTAAHCVNDIESLSLITGVKPLASEEGLMLTPLHIDRHEQYNEKSIIDRNDLAIVTIAEEVQLAKKDFPQLPDENMIQKIEAANNIEFMAVGYGKTTSIVNPEERTEGVLRAVRLQTTSKNSAVFMVSQTNGKGVCYGDSGGPALKIYNKNLYLIGVASGIYDVDTIKVDECKQGSLYMNIAPHIAWIRTIIK